MGDPFGRLPLELLLPLLKALPDLAAMHSLRGASPAVAAVFRSDSLAVEVVEAVIVTSAALRVGGMMRVTCLLIAQPPPSWDAFWGRFLVRFQRGERPLVSGLVAAADVRRLLALATAVYAASNRCLHTLLARCARLRPRRLADPGFDWRFQKLWRVKCYSDQPYVPPPPFPDEPLCDAAAMAAAAAPPVAWVEAQRVLHGGWQLAFYSVLREALASGETEERGAAMAEPGRETRPEDDDPLQSPLHLFRRMNNPKQSPLYFFRRMNREPGLHNRYLETLVDAEWDPTEKGLHFLSSSTPACLRLADAYPDAKADAAAGSARFNYTGHTAPMPPDWRPGSGHLGATQRPMSVFFVARSSYWSPLQHGRSAPLRGIGIFIWESPRMVALNLLCSEETIQTRFNGNALRAEHSAIYTWYSLLTADERLALQDKQRCVYEQLRRMDYEGLPWK